MQTIAKELRQVSEGGNSAEAMKNLEAMVMKLGDPETTGLTSKLPSGRQQFIYADALALDLKLRAAYSPGRLKMQLNEIEKLLAAAPRDRSNLVSRPAAR